ncbi:MAG: thermonuclease family protein [Chloroflexota bacterium]
MRSRLSGAPLPLALLILVAGVVACAPARAEGKPAATDAGQAGDGVPPAPAPSATLEGAPSGAAPLVVPPGDTLIEARVTRAIDGNSLDAHVHGNRTAVGYLGVETPLRNQRCGPEALLRNRELAGGRVLLEPDPAYPFDDLGRRLYYAYTTDGVSIDETLIREGLGMAARTDARHGAYLAAVQAEAQAAGRGCLWSDSGADPTGGESAG